MYIIQYFIIVICKGLEQKKEVHVHINTFVILLTYNVSHKTRLSDSTDHYSDHLHTMQVTLLKSSFSYFLPKLKQHANNKYYDFNPII